MNNIDLSVDTVKQSSYQVEVSTEGTQSTSSTVHIEEPETYKQAIQVEEWCQAMTVELAAFEANVTWEVVPLPSNKKAVGCRWLYKVKYHANGQVDRYKARLVAKGFTQTANMNYFETFAPVAKMTSFRLLLAVAAMNQWKISQLDVTNAFLHGTLDEEVYMTLLLGYVVPDDVKAKFPNQKLVWRLLKSLYGLKPAPRQWFIALSTTLLSFGFLQTHGNNVDLMAHITEFLGSHFKIKDLGPLHFFLGIQIQHSSQEG